ESGVWGAIKRAFGGGYVEYTTSSESYHLQNVPAVIQQDGSWLHDTLDRVQRTGQDYVVRLLREVHSREMAVEEKRKNTLTSAERARIRGLLDALVRELSAAIDRAPRGQPHGATDSNGVQDDTVTLEAPSFAVKLCQAANLVASRQCVAFRRALFSRIGLTAAQQRVFLATWDGESLDTFCGRFLADAALPSLLGRASGTFEDKAPFRSIMYVDQARLPAADLRTLAGLATASPATLVLMLDAEQPGSTRNQLQRSALLPILCQFSAVVAVIQSVAGLWRSPAFIEALAEFDSILKELPCSVTGVIANHPDLRVSSLADALICVGADPGTIEDEKRLRMDLGFTDPSEDDTNFAAEVLRQWHAHLANRRPSRRRS
ncbi:MAG TPA: hypothetical protein PLI95_13290, partial [Polyangiaceae bacterium]|nr:hypothetical protein [Polyangiaceae bacterium]